MIDFKKLMTHEESLLSKANLIVKRDSYCEELIKKSQQVKKIFDWILAVPFDRICCTKKYTRVLNRVADRRSRLLAELYGKYRVHAHQINCSLEVRAIK